jgi:hypothetical protein
MTNLKTSVAGIAATLIVMFTSSACSGGPHSKVASLGNTNGSSSSSQGTDGSKQSFRDAMLDFSKCMRQHGVDMPDPTFTDGAGGDTGGAVMMGGPGKDMDPNSATFKSAQTACQPIMDAAQKNFTPPSPEEQAKMRDQAVKFAQCMRGKGFDVPDPTFDDSGGMKIESRQAPSGSSGGPSSDGPAAGGPDPAFQHGVEECSKETGAPGMGLSTVADGGK